jgi:hypothetical protein
MKIKIFDKEALSSIKFLDMTAYLSSKGWRETNRKQNHWVSLVKDGDFEVTVPLTRDINDYARRIFDALSILETVEKRSQQEIFSDVSAVMTDVIRIKIGNGEIAEGQLPLEEGVKIVDKARDLLLAAACSTIQPKPLFQKRQPDEAREYLKKVRLGQTERGSYTITLHSPVPPCLGQATLFPDASEVFERRVTTTLIKGLNTAKTAAEAGTGNVIDAFKNGVPSGISANLCDALSGLMDFGEIRRDANISINWASTRPVHDAAIISSIRFTPDYIPILSEVARIFRENEPREDFTAIGSIYKLVRNEIKMAPYLYFRL